MILSSSSMPFLQTKWGNTLPEKCKSADTMAETLGRLMSSLGLILLVQIPQLATPVKMSPIQNILCKVSIQFS